MSKFKFQIILGICTALLAIFFIWYNITVVRMANGFLLFSIMFVIAFWYYTNKYYWQIRRIFDTRSHFKEYCLKKSNPNTSKSRW